jgi:hypothetical protein
VTVYICRWPGCSRNQIHARGLCNNHYERANEGGVLYRFPTRAEEPESPANCQCDEPDPEWLALWQRNQCRKCGKVILVIER